MTRDVELTSTRVVRVMVTIWSCRRLSPCVPVLWGSCEQWTQEASCQQTRAVPAAFGRVHEAFTLVVSLSTRQPTRPASPFILQKRAEEKGLVWRAWLGEAGGSLALW